MFVSMYFVNLLVMRNSDDFLAIVGLSAEFLWLHLAGGAHSSCWGLYILWSRGRRAAHDTRLGEL